MRFRLDNRDYSFKERMNLHHVLDIFESHFYKKGRVKLDDMASFQLEKQYSKSLNAKNYNYFDIGAYRIFPERWDFWAALERRHARDKYKGLHKEAHDEGLDYKAYSHQRRYPGFNT